MSRAILDKAQTEDKLLQAVTDALTFGGWKVGSVCPVTTFGRIDTDAEATLRLCDLRFSVPGLSESPRAFRSRHDVLREVRVGVPPPTPDREARTVGAATDSRTTPTRRAVLGEGRNHRVLLAMEGGTDREGLRLVPDERWPEASLSSGLRADIWTDPRRARNRPSLPSPSVCKSGAPRGRHGQGEPRPHPASVHLPSWSLAVRGVSAQVDGRHRLLQSLPS